MFEVSKINYLAKTNTNRYNERLSNMLLFAKIDHFGYAYHETINCAREAHGPKPSRDTSPNGPKACSCKA